MTYFWLLLATSTTIVCCLPLSKAKPLPVDTITPENKLSLQAEIPNGDSLLLNQYPMLMTHDSGTGYMAGKPTLLPSPNWGFGIVQCHRSAFARQLDIGVRAFDLRAMGTKPSTLVYQHTLPAINFNFGKLFSSQLPEWVSDAVSSGSFNEATTSFATTTLEQSFEEMKLWLEKHPTELVILQYSDLSNSFCASGLGSAIIEDCAKALTTLFNTSGIYVFDKCEELETMTVGQAKNISKLKKGGSLMALHISCSLMGSNWDIANTCNGWDVPLGESRWDITAKNCTTIKSCVQGNETDPSWEYFWNYMQIKSDSSVYNPQKVSPIQAFWQSDAGPDGQKFLLCGTSVNGVLNPFGKGSRQTVHSIIKNAEISRINYKIAEKIKNGEFKDRYLNFVMVDNVDAGGKELYEALTQYQLSFALKQSQ